jgi:uracil-DNA glycosylase
MKIEKSWHEKLKEELQKPYIQELKNFLEKEKVEGKIVYPPEPLIFNAFLQTPFDKVKVVIMGQDPYHGAGQAHGLSFSVPRGITPPPSLKNIFKELAADVAIPTPEHGCLMSWAQQGVLLLNAILTVRAGEPKSHDGIGWEQFTDAVIDLLAQKKERLVFLLWGKSAQDKCHKVLGTHHLVLQAAHPSPYSAQNFFGCRHFSKANAVLSKPIDWTVR